MGGGGGGGGTHSGRGAAASPTRHSGPHGEVSLLTTGPGGEQVGQQHSEGGGSASSPAAYIGPWRALTAAVAALVSSSRSATAALVRGGLSWWLKHRSRERTRPPPTNIGAAGAAVCYHPNHPTAVRDRRSSLSPCLLALVPMHRPPHHVVAPFLGAWFFLQMGVDGGGGAKAALPVFWAPTRVSTRPAPSLCGGLNFASTRGGGGWSWKWSWRGAKHGMRCA